MAMLRGTVVLILLVGVAGARTAARHPKGGGGMARAALMSDDSSAAQMAARQLGENKSQAALNALLDGLALGLPSEVAFTALESVARHANAASLPIVLRYAQHRNPELRAQAVGAL